MYETNQKLRDAVNDWSIAMKILGYRTTHSDTQRARHVCRHRSTPGVNCQWSVSGYVRADGSVEVTKISAEHTCAGAVIQGTHIPNEQDWLQWRIPYHVDVTHTTRTSELQSMIRMTYFVTTNYRATYRARKAILCDALDDQKEQFTKAPAYLQRLEEANSRLFTDLRVINKK